MSTLTIRNVDADTKDKLRLAAAANGWSIEEVRSVLAQPAAAKGLGSRMNARFAAIGGVDLVLPERLAPARAADWGDTDPGDLQ
jgi:plasmid stability protein